VKRTLAVAERELREAQHTLADLKAKLDARPAAPDAPRGDRCLEPVPRLADVVKDVEQARCLLAELTERIAEGLQERDALLEYVLTKQPDAPEQTERERLPQTHNSRIFKIRIGSQERDKWCPTCGQPAKEACSAHLFLGFFDDGRLGELFCQLGRARRYSMAAGGFHMASRMTSLALQHGASIETVVRQMRYQKDSSGGMPYGPDGPIKGTTGVGSLVDYMAVVIDKAVEDRKKENG
jgi:hypothetical protein